MRLLADRVGAAARARVMECPDCGMRIVWATTQTSDPRLWVVAGVARGDEDQEIVEPLLEDEAADDGLRLSEVLARAVALLGLPWPVVIAGSAVVAREQLRAFEMLPDWMLTEVPLDVLWRTRRVVFGGGLERVPAAISAVRDAYDPGGRPLAGWLA